ncbi:hypothetical protein FA15DRAFT_659251 [Coprinopsis marcescibilis]|uniref:Uncharacterized protein n=1 Tax=Coprinopsis marcescibilis TaxID=230819 RepID=A0A5C3KK12_COPMA|nr:hypothetical protein FA15DRAFT_659251 [Coprinopsis marcescibilis]
MSSVRFITFDDGHQDIQYEGEWEVDHVQHEGPFRSEIVGGSQHRTSGKASVAFSFQGRAVSLYGRNIRRDENAGQSGWQCFVDGRIYSRPSALIVQNNFQYCSITGLNPDTAHKLTVRIQATEDAPFWVDSIDVSPSANLAYHKALSNYSVVLGVNDTSILYGPGWEFPPGNRLERLTNTEHSFMEVEFIGTQVSWKGRAFADQSASQSRATYSLDGGPMHPFSILGSEENTVQHTLFQTAKVPRNLHRLKVVYNGHEAPLVLSHLIIAQGDILNRNPHTLGPELDGLPIDTVPRLPSASGRPVGAIVGGVMGGAAALLLLALTGILIHKQKKQRVHFENAQAAADAYGASLTPITSPPPTYSARLSRALRRHVSGDYSSIPLTEGPGRSGIPRKVHFDSSSKPRAHNDSGIRLNSRMTLSVPPAYTPM